MITAWFFITMKNGITMGLNRKIVLFIFAFCSLYFVQAQQATYKNASFSSEERAKDLLKRMTLEEKVGQLLCPMGWEMYEKQNKKVNTSHIYRNMLDEHKTGMFWATFRADPWTKKTLASGLTPEQAAQAANELQRYAVKNTRLGIPVFLAEEAPHGHMAIRTTVFPTGIGQAATFNPVLMRKMGEIIGKEIRLQGAHIGYGPVLDLVRDPRWSRVEETYGEDPCLASVMGTAVIEGMGGGDLSKPYSVISTLKHFIAYGVPEAGQNGNQSVVGERDLQESFLPPFKAAIDAGALSVMTSYNSMDGIPSTMNKRMLRDVLRDEWGFKGYTVSDLFSIEGIKDSHFVAETKQQAAIYAVEAGTNVDLGGEAYIELINAVKEGKIEESVIDEAVANVLRLKFEMGLFEHPYVDPKKAKEVVGSEEHTTVARQMAQQSIVLLENRKQLLPLRKQNIKVAVIGPNADNIYNMLGDYTAPQASERIKTVLEGVREKVGTENVLYVQGCAVRDTTHSTIGEAVRAVLESDVAIVVVGGSSARDFKTSYKETGAAVASKESVSDMECGEGYDRLSLDLLGKQMDLLKAVKATGKPIIVIYIQGRPLDMNWASMEAGALLTAWYPGQEGGTAIADVLFGDYNPSGRLPISIPRHIGQIPCFYNKRNPKGHNYVEAEFSPLYAFGYGKSYTDFVYDALRVNRLPDGNWQVEFEIENRGMYDGTEVPQLYVRDEYASTVRPMLQLCDFCHVELKKGEKKKVTFLLKENDLALVDINGKRVVEPGEFTLMLGVASDDIKLKKTIHIK